MTRRRRRPSSTAVLVCLVLGVLASVYAFDWLAGRGAIGLPWAVPDLLPASARDYPRAGVEEAGARLADPVTVAAPDPSYAFQQTRVVDGATVPVTWSPCRPVHVVVDPTSAPAGFEAQVAAAVGDVAAATGLTFTLDPPADEPTDLDRAMFQPDRYGDRWAPVLVGFADETAVPDLSGTVAGIAQVNGATGRTGDPHLVSGTVYLDVQLLAPDHDPAAYLAVLRHELAHVVGLDHVDDPTQLMNPTTGVASFQAGDLTGLAELGRGPCAPGV